MRGAHLVGCRPFYACEPLYAWELLCVGPSMRGTFYAWNLLCVGPVVTLAPWLIRGTALTVVTARCSRIVMLASGVCAPICWDASLSTRNWRKWRQLNESGGEATSPRPTVRTERRRPDDFVYSPCSFNSTPSCSCRCDDTPSAPEKTEPSTNNPP